MLAGVAEIEPVTYCFQSIFFLTDWPGRVFVPASLRGSITGLFKIGQLRVLAAFKMLPQDARNEEWE